MGTQNQTPNSQTQQPNRSGTAGKENMKRGQKGQDAGNVARSDDDVIDEASTEGTREDAAGTQSQSSSSDRNESN